MIQKNLLEQLQILYKIFINNKNVFLISIIAIISFIIFQVANKLSNKKITKLLFLILYIGIFGTLLYFYNNQILTFIDYLINNIFILLFFPNLAIYTLIIIISNILIIKTIFRKNNKVLKNINIIFFILFNIIFYLIIDNVSKNNINVYEQLSIYTNSDLLVLIQVSMYLFMFWLIILFIDKFSNKFIIGKKKQIVFNNVYSEVEVPKKIKKHFKNKLVISNDVKNINKKLKNIKTPILNNIDSIEVNDKIIEEDKDIVKDSITNSDRKTNIYNSYIDVVPVKKNKSKEKNHIILSSIETIINDNIEVDSTKDMDVLFGKQSFINNIMSDIEKLKDDKNNQVQIKKIYDEISLNSKDLTLSDYNYLINALKKIRNNN